MWAWDYDYELLSKLAFFFSAFNVIQWIGHWIDAHAPRINATVDGKFGTFN